MLNRRVKIIAIFIIFSTCKPGFCQLTLENIFLKNKYAPKPTHNIRFLHTQAQFAHLTNTSEGKVIKFFTNNNEFVHAYQLSQFQSDVAVNKNDLDNLIFSNTDAYFLVSSNCQQQYRRSSMCNYFIGSKAGKLISLSSTPQYFPAFSPNDKYIAYIKYNNLFFKNIADNIETAVTKDGEWNTIINGKSDWVYEEELKLTRAYEWNAQSDKIAYLKFDESNVREYSIPMYYDLKYPSFFTYKYPKVGEENSRVSVWYYDIRSKKNKQITLPFSYEYMPRIYWNAAGDEIVAMLLNRHQDTLQLVGYNVKTKKTRQLYVETDKTFIDIPATVRFLSDNSFMITSEKDGYNHIYHYDANGKLIKQLTKGSFEVKELYDVNEKNKLVYYQSNEGNEIETAVFSLNYETLEKKKLTLRNGSNKALFSNDGSCFIHTYSSDTIAPISSLVQTNTNNAIIIADNRSLQDSLKNIPRKEFITIPCKGYTLNTWLIKPATIDSTRKYPLLMFVYGGPHNQEVLNEWQKTRDLFFNFLAQQGIIVACVDNRGSDGSGAEFKKSIFLQLGKLETEDQALAATYLGNLSFIDKDRIAMYGWSYGGFVAANCLFEENDVFKTAIAVAPVTDWSLYDNIYTERYMRTPVENPDGYNNYNPLVLAKKLTGNLLLIHGTADDNVHFQHSIQLIHVLNEAGKIYQLYINPDSAHGTTTKQMRFDLYNKMYQFLREKL